MKATIPWMKPRRVRRAVVGGAALCYVVCLGLGAAAFVEGGRQLMLAGFGFAAGCLALASLLLASGIPAPNDRELDERQRRVVLEAMSRSYRLVTALMMVLLAGGLFIEMSGWKPGDTSEWSPLLVAIALLVPFLPTALIAWQEPE